MLIVKYLVLRLGNKKPAEAGYVWRKAEELNPIRNGYRTTRFQGGASHRRG